MKSKILLTTAILAMLGTAALELSAHASITIQTPKRSQSTGEKGNAILVDENAKRLQVCALVFPDSSGHSGLPSAHVVAGRVSPVTGKEEPARYSLANGTEIPICTLVSVNTSTHALQPAVLPGANVALAGDLSGTAAAAVVATVGGQAAANVSNAAILASAEQGIVVLGNFATGGSVGAASATVNVARVLSVAQTTASQTLTLPSPTQAAQAKVVYVYNSGSASFTLLGATVAAGAAQGALWNGSAWIAL